MPQKRIECLTAFGPSFMNRTSVFEWNKKIKEGSRESVRDDERGCDESHRHPHTRGLPWGLLEVVWMVQLVHCNWRRLLRRGLEFHACTINKSAHTKKSGNLSNNPRIYHQRSSPGRGKQKVRLSSLILVLQVVKEKTNPEYK